MSESGNFIVITIVEAIIDKASYYAAVGGVGWMKFFMTENSRKEKPRNIQKTRVVNCPSATS